MCTRTYGLMNVLAPLTSDCSSRGAEPQETTSNCVIERLTLSPASSGVLPSGASTEEDR